MNTTAAVRRAWDDKFREPALDELLADINPLVRPLFDDALARIRAFDGGAEKLAWQGLPWRWCLVFTIESDPTEAWLYLVPDPERLRIAVPFTEAMIQAMPVHRFKRHLKDALGASVHTGNVFWATFETTAKVQLDDILDVVKRKYQLVRTAKV